jgi:hypothetical protein
VRADFYPRRIGISRLESGSHNNLVSGQKFLPDLPANAWLWQAGLSGHRPEAAVVGAGRQIKKGHFIPIE